MTPTTDRDVLIVIGATGDLTGRLLLPALARLEKSGDLARTFQLVGAGPQPWDEATFRDHARDRLSAHAGDLDPAVRESFLSSVTYRHVDVEDPSSVRELIEPWRNSRSVTVYLALPTRLLATTVEALRTSELPATVRVAVEKPFGDDLPGAVALNSALAGVVPNEHNIFRVDHVLGMAKIQDLPRTVADIRRGSATSSTGIEQVSIVWEETLALEGRAAFYDGAGALKDLLQNHLMQILCLVTLDPAAAQGNSNLAAARLSALQAIEVPSVDTAATVSRRARYTAGRLATTGGANGGFVPDYVSEPGVDPQRETETFAEVVFRVSSPEWLATRFVLRAGKAMGHRRRGVLIRVRTTDRSTAESTTHDVWIDVDRADDLPSGPTGDDLVRSPALLEQLAYVEVLRSVLSGSNALSVTASETELAWTLFTPILQAWAARRVPLEEYPAGTEFGPRASTPESSRGNG